MDITTLTPEQQKEWFEHLQDKLRQQQQTILQQQQELYKHKRVDDTEEDQDIFQSTKRFKSSDFSDDFKKNLQKLQNQALPPSSASWDLLVVGKVIEKFEDFQLQVQENTIGISNIEDQMECINGEKFDFVQKKIKDLVRRDNEGYSMLICGNFLVHIVDELQKNESKKKYELTIFSVILKNLGDRRYDKRSDYVIFQLKNQRCLAVIELKLSVGSALAAKKKELAQLFLETHYAHLNDEQSKYRHLLSILADADNWHIFIVDLRTPLNICKYCFLFQPAIPILCKTIQYFLAQLQ